MTSVLAAEPFWQRFLTSAGFGGLMALTAALIAARIATQQLRHTKSQQANERWWTTLTWVYDRAVVEKDKRVALPHHVTFAMLTQLAERAQQPPADRLQQSSIKSILAMFEATDDGTAPQQGTIEVSDPAAAALLDDLRTTLSNDEELRERAEQLRYLESARTAVEREAAALGADVSGQNATVAVSWRGREVLVQIRYAREPIPTLTLLQAVDRLQRDVAAGHTTIGGILVVTALSRPAIDAFLAARNSTGIEVVAWTGSPDDRLLHEALQRLRPAPTP
ncbi:hypothetical protein [Actinoplanes friuliensis]|uniref:Uncharacterized protein n=1 Tax=Actinoplanes friuliensis DSM 7358 TaxID=1246995 RepID=U5W2L3_9ACTN|nr:hypothetical protein [Actinoplanes friuliensis]AGZ43252.1 hypothetical protein AFR_24930 [Actinoplanes friuliensis DSM 7358]